MAKLKAADKGLIFSSCIFNHEKIDATAVESIWKERYRLSGSLIPQTTPSFAYYSKEMGSGLSRLILWSHEHYCREELVAGKLWADGVEGQHLDSESRVINMDIGILVKEQMILATSKPYAHRIYLGSGVYADLTYKYENKSYQFLPWTYPDYKCPEKVELFNSLRTRLF
ncbi:MAG: hypothetical protein CME64_17645 [Halobacteriovoraceae bacterium]|nr:hypothetical protein [Halobacteriovoraceae bacterium]|tara:strand:+ start:52324 stop:52833 length:510 start_codon:yes stop_codon:yes gene_type:complete